MPNSFLFVSGLAAALSFVQPVFAQTVDPRPAALATHHAPRERIVGTWRLVSVYEENAGGEDIDVFGTDPQGQFIATDAGHFSFQIISREGRRLGANQQVTRVSETNGLSDGAGLRDALAYFGRYSLDQESGTLTLRVTYCLLRSCDKTVRKASIAFEGDKLVLTSASDPSPTGSFYSRLVWRRD